MKDNTICQCKGRPVDEGSIRALKGRLTEHQRRIVDEVERMLGSSKAAKQDILSVVDYFDKFYDFKPIWSRKRYNKEPKAEGSG
jgi:hypothetical protein